MKVRKNCVVIFNKTTKMFFNSIINSFVENLEDCSLYDNIFMASEEKTT